MCIERHIQRRSEWCCLGDSPMRNSPKVGKMKTPTHQTWSGGIREEQRDDGAHAPAGCSCLIMTVHEGGCHLLSQTSAHWKTELSTAHLPHSTSFHPWESALPLTSLLPVCIMQALCWMKEKREKREKEREEEAQREERGPRLVSVGLTQAEEPQLRRFPSLIVLQESLGGIFLVNWL